MPRVTTKTKSRSGKDYTCESCHKKIEPGTKYYKWSFRYGGTHRQCAACGMPKQSQLTQSKMSGFYAAIEAAEAAINSATSIDDLASALNDCAQAVDEVRQEYEDGLDNMPDGLRAAAEEGEVGEKMQALEEFKDNLESKATDLEGEEFEDECQYVEQAGGAPCCLGSDDEVHTKEEGGHAFVTNEEGRTEWFNEKRQEAEDALSDHSL